MVITPYSDLEMTGKMRSCILAGLRIETSYRPIPSTNPMETIQGIPVSSGIAIGRAFVLDAVERYVPERKSAEDVESEIERLWLAIGGALEELKALRTKTEEELGADPAKILDFHIGILQDPTLMNPVQQRIREGLVNAERAVAERFEQLAQQFRGMGSAVFRQKANDIIDLDRRVLGRLLGQTDDRLAEIEGAVVLVAHELTPSQAASIDRSKILAIATDAGGRTSHTSIIARALQIPSVVGCHALTNTTQDGDKVIVDGEQGVVLVRPEDTVIHSYEERQVNGRNSFNCRSSARSIRSHRMAPASNCSATSSSRRKRPPPSRTAVTGSASTGRNSSGSSQPCTDRGRTVRGLSRGDRTAR